MGPATPTAPRRRPEAWTTRGDGVAWESEHLKAAARGSPSCKQQGASGGSRSAPALPFTSDRDPATSRVDKDSARGRDHTAVDLVLRPLHTRRSHCTLCTRGWWPRRSVWGEQRPFLGSADVRTQKRPPTCHLPDRPRACASLDVCRGLHSSRGSELRDGCGRRREGRAVPCVAVGGRRLKLSGYLCAGHLRERVQRQSFEASLSGFQKFPFAA